MQGQSKLLLGQNVTPRHPRGFRLTALLALTVPSVLMAGAFALGTRFPAHASSWPPAHIKLIPPISEPQGAVFGYVSTDDRFVLQVVWEPVRGATDGPRYLGVQRTHDLNACIIHVAAESPLQEQVKDVQAGAAECLGVSD